MNEITNKVYDIFKKSNKSKIAVICIGTDKHIGDSLGPLVGQLLHEKYDYIECYGDIFEPIHALNIDTRLADIYRKIDADNTFIIGVDACLGEENDIGTIDARDRAIRPGHGVGKELSEVGDMSLIGFVDSHDSCDIFSYKAIRLAFVYDLARKITEIIAETYDLIKSEEKAVV